LPAGESDPRWPYAEDEVYYVIAGQAMFRRGAAERPVQPGTVLYVPAGQEHRFERIAADLVLLVLFALAESAPERLACTIW
jgi:mannose-6-phosphate isomerase-like protein (cupin superfamily)